MEIAVVFIALFTIIDFFYIVSNDSAHKHESFFSTFIELVLQAQFSKASVQVCTAFERFLRA